MTPRWMSKKALAIYSSLVQNLPYHIIESLLFYYNKPQTIIDTGEGPYAPRGNATLSLIHGIIHNEDGPAIIQKFWIGVNDIPKLVIVSIWFFQGEVYRENEPVLEVRIQTDELIAYKSYFDSKYVMHHKCIGLPLDIPYPFWSSDIRPYCYKGCATANVVRKANVVRNQKEIQDVKICLDCYHEWV